MYKVLAVQPASTDAKPKGLRTVTSPFPISKVSTSVDMAGLSTHQHSNTWAEKVQMRLNLEWAVAVMFGGESHCVLWKGIKLQLRMLPNKHQGDISLRFTVKWVERSGDHLLDNLVKMQTKLLFTFQLFAQEPHKCLKSLARKKLEISQVEELKHNISTAEPKKELGKISHNLLPIPWHTCCIFTYLQVHLLSISESLSIQPLSEAKAYLSTTTFQ